MGRQGQARVEWATTEGAEREAEFPYGGVRPRLVLVPEAPPEEVSRTRAIWVSLLGATCGAMLAPGLFVGQFYFISALVRSLEWAVGAATGDPLTPLTVEALGNFLGQRLLTDSLFLEDFLSRLFFGLLVTGFWAGYVGAVLSLVAGRWAAGASLLTGGGFAALAVVLVGPARLLYPAVPGPWAMLVWPSLFFLLFGLTCTIACCVGGYAATNPAGRRA